MSFATEDALSAQLRDWNEEYQKYSARLWQRGVRTYAHLANAAEGRYKAAGVDNEYHIDDIKAKAGAAAPGGGSAAGSVDLDLLSLVVSAAVKDVAEPVLSKLSVIESSMKEVGGQLQILSRLQLEEFRTDDTPSVVRREFKQHLVAHYEPSHNGTSALQCMATGLRVDFGDIQAGHVIGVKHKKYAQLMGFDVMSARNGILWLSVLEDAWSKRQFCFTCPSGGQDVVFTLLDPELEHVRLVDYGGTTHLKRDTKSALGDLTFGQLSGRPLSQPALADKRPYKRALCFMANVHRQLAEKAGWLLPDQALHGECYEYWSEFECRGSVQQWLAANG